LFVAGVLLLATACSTSPPSESPLASGASTPAPGSLAPPPTIKPTPTPLASCPPVEPAAPEPASAARTSSSLGSDPPVPGERLVLQGVLLGASCAPDAAMTLSFWHTDSRGIYGPADTRFGGDQCCWYTATLTTDSEGRFELRTIRPATDPVAGGEIEPHIHVALEVGGQSQQDGVIVFEGEAITPSGPRVFAIPLESRSDANGQYWWGFVVLRL
jgi:protocatechuate 3,4-dioxygenase beta subunit